MDVVNAGPELVNGFNVVSRLADAVMATIIENAEMRSVEGFVQMDREIIVDSYGERMRLNEESGAPRRRIGDCGSKKLYEARQQPISTFHICHTLGVHPFPY